MKYSRPAPPPPAALAGQQQMKSFNTDMMPVKPKPPRPPPPSTKNPQESKPASKLFSNLFGASKKNNKSNDKLSQMEVKLPPPKLPPPSIAALQRHHNTTPVQQQQHPQLTSDVQLINFDESPPASPVGFQSIKKSNTGGSDSVSMDSFCSSNSSPNNLGFNSGTTSQAESGFEDDFSVSDFKVTSRAASRSTTFSNDPFDCLDDFSSTASTPSTALPVKSNIHANIRNMKPLIQPKPVSIGNTNFYAPTANSSNPSPANFDDSLSNGKNLIKSTVVSMPTIIKPASSASTNRKPSPIHVPSTQKSDFNKIPTLYKPLDSTSDESFEDEPPSPPMPTIPPPPPPVLVLDQLEDDEEKESYGIALFDFESDVTEDLNFKANEKIYLISKMNDEWMYGRNKRGCEGIFPVSYIDIKVPLKNPETDSGTASRSESVSPASGSNVRVLYTFNAETEEDLTIYENEIVTVLYEINSEWLYGVNASGQCGQFPANFLEFIPQNLLPMPK